MRALPLQWQPLSGRVSSAIATVHDYPRVPLEERVQVAQFAMASNDVHGIGREAGPRLRQRHRGSRRRDSTSQGVLRGHALGIADTEIIRFTTDERRDLAGRNPSSRLR